MYFHFQTQLVNNAGIWIFEVVEIHFHLLIRYHTYSLSWLIITSQRNVTWPHNNGFQWLFDKKMSPTDSPSQASEWTCLPGYLYSPLCSRGGSLSLNILKHFAISYNYGRQKHGKAQIKWALPTATEIHVLRYNHIRYTDSYRNQHKIVIYSINTIYLSLYIF